MHAVFVRRTQIVLVAAGLAVLAGGGTAIAAKSRDHAGSRQRGILAPSFVLGLGRGGLLPLVRPVHDLQTAASYLGTTVDTVVAQLRSGKTLAQIADATSGKSASGLIAALVADEQDELKQAVSNGTLTQAQADTIGANLTQRVTDLVNGVRRPLPFAPGLGHHLGFGLFGGLHAAATYLGLTNEQLLMQLGSGKTLAQIADATSGKSASGLVDAIVAGVKNQLAQAVKDGHLTQAQSDAITSRLQQLVTNMVNGTAPRLPLLPRVHPGGFGFGFPFGRDHHRPGYTT